MKKRVFLEMDNAVYRVAILTEDWSEGDLSLMDQYGEPEVNVGGEFEYLFEGETKVKTLGDDFVRVLHGFPLSRGFDSRDYSSSAEAIAVGNAWKDMVLRRLDATVHALRENVSPLPTEEVTEI